MSPCNYSTELTCFPCIAGSKLSVSLYNPVNEHTQLIWTNHQIWLRNTGCLVLQDHGHNAIWFTWPLQQSFNMLCPLVLTDNKLICPSFCHSHWCRACFCVHCANNELRVTQRGNGRGLFRISFGMLPGPHGVVFTCSVASSTNCGYCDVFYVFVREVAPLLPQHSSSRHHWWSSNRQL